MGGMRFSRTRSIVRHATGRNLPVTGTLVARVIGLLAVLLLAALALGPVAFADGFLSSDGSAASPLESPLVVPEVNQLLGGQPAREAEEARQASPEATVEREESQTKYEGLDTEEAAKLAEQVFPGVMQDPDGGLPPLPEGASMVGYAGNDAAQLELFRRDTWCS
jgi:hypothetical protein